MRPAALVLCAMTFPLAGCGFPSGRPTLSFPSSVSNGDPVQTATVTVSARPLDVYSMNVSGVVKAAGMAVAGATVVVVADGLVTSDSRTAITDSGGHYDIPAVAVRMWAGPLISAHQPGYFTDVKWSPKFGDQAVDFDLSPVTYAQLDTAVRSDIADVMCQGRGIANLSVPCHRVVIKAPATGVLDVTVSTPAIRGDLDVWGPKGKSLYYGECPCTFPLAFQLPVEKGETYEIRVMVTPAIELTAALRVS